MLVGSALALADGRAAALPAAAALLGALLLQVGANFANDVFDFEKGADTGGFENGWHHDVTWREVPSMGAILHAIQVPPTGGDTLFADMGAAYDGLTDEADGITSALSGATTQPSRKPVIA